MPPDRSRSNEVIFFVDRCFGKRKVVNALRIAGYATIAHDELFKQNEKDHIWLKQVAKMGYLILTFDEHLRTNTLEREAIRNSKASVFVLVSKRLTGDAMAEAFVKAAAAMIRFAQKHQRQPFIAKVYATGEVKEWKWEHQL